MERHTLVKIKVMVFVKLTTTRILYLFIYLLTRTRTSSRPKNAPMIQYTENVGIPTSFWYLTGYIMSLEGAKYLLNSLPVRGPVDSWIGMKATANWENEYGHRIGVGTAPKAKVYANELPSRKQLGDIVKFRAFAALTPLCSQKLAWKSASSMSRDTAKWRERDTDVTYSGHQ
jgi:hypothetical protein